MTDRQLGGVYITLCAAASLTAIVWTGFHVALNDFWGNLTLAQQIDWTSPASFYNLFFPFGYTLLLRLAGEHAIVAAHVVNLASAVLLLTVTWRFGARLMDLRWSLLATMLLSIHPEVFRYVTTPGADLPMAALAAAGFHLLYWTEGDRADIRRALAAGALLGASALMRHHALVFDAAAVIATVIGRVVPPRHILLAAAAFFTVHGLQMSVAVIAGHGPLQTGQAFNVHKLIHGVDWFHVAAQPAPASVWTVVTAEPRAFASAYSRELLSLWLLPLAPAALAVVSREQRLRKFGAVAGLTTAAYLAVVAAGGSSRGPLPVRFLVALAAVAVLREVVIRTRSGRLSPWSSAAAVASALVVAVAALLWLRADFGFVKYRARDHATYGRIETLLKRDGVASAGAVFASDFTLYFPTLAHFRPRTNGSWLRIEGAAYAHRFPELCVATVDCFREDARRSGVTHVVLTPDARYLSPAFGAVAASAPADDLELVGRDAHFSVYRLKF